MSATRPTPMGAFLVLRRPDVQVVATDTYQFAGVKSFGGGVFASGVKQGSSFSYRQLTRLRAEEFVYPKLMAWEGALGTVPPECDGMVVSPEFCVFEVDRRIVMPAFLNIYFRQPTVWPMLAGAAAGTNLRRRRIYPEDFLRFEMSVPPLGIQAQVVTVDAAIAAVRRVQAELDAELESLLPSVLDHAIGQPGRESVRGTG